MYFFSKESLENLRRRIDLLEILSSHVEMKRQGASYKGLCPFHEEKSPSFIMQKGDTHYHCFGCGAHGDGIAFLMNYLNMSFMDAVEHLAEKFHVPLEKMEGSGAEKGPNKAVLKEALEKGCRFYQFHLLYTREGEEALRYLAGRGIGKDFIRRYRIGLAPKKEGLFSKYMKKEKVSEEDLIATGLLSERTRREFFQERILFPVQNATGAVIGFSGRKFHESTYGGKYVNTPETPLFKKSRILYGLNFCRRTISKERKAIIVEGQVDALRLIDGGFPYAVAGQGTAFGEGHVRELVNLGVHQVYLALDSDSAGLKAAAKIGDLFQKNGVEVFVVPIPQGSDPDSIIQEKGCSYFSELLQKSVDYLNFLIQVLSQQYPPNSPAAKNEIVNQMSKQIRGWEDPVMVYESLRKLANILQVPEDLVGVGMTHVPHVYTKKMGHAGGKSIDPDAVLEGDLLRWLFLGAEDADAMRALLQEHLSIQDFQNPTCQMILQTYLQVGFSDLLTFAGHLEDGAAQNFLSELMQKKGQ